MTAANWITLGVILFGYLMGMIGIFINFQLQLKELEMKILAQDEKFKEYDKNNRNAHSDLKKYVSSIDKKIDRLIDKLL